MVDLLFRGVAVWFAVPALIGTVFFLLRTALMLFGGTHDFQHDFSMDTDVDIHTDIDADHGDSGTAFKVLSVQAIAAFMMGFGWGGLTAVRGWGLPAWLGVGVAVGTGSAMVWVLGKLLTWIYRMQSSGNIPIAAALDEEATVDILVPARRQGRGAVRVVIGDRQRFYHAVTEGDAIESHARVRVTGINEDNSLTVERLFPELPHPGV